jgi:5-methyltetrahydropteroyltriglutamate--homocysteine methyltransferase
MCRGYQKDGLDVTPIEMTKWFDTNYHYLVPEFEKGQTFSLAGTKAIDEFNEAKTLGIQTKPVLLGPFSFLKLGKEQHDDFNRMELIHSLLLIYIELIGKLEDAGANCIQIDEPCLVTDLTEYERNLYRSTLTELFGSFPGIRFVLATYFESIEKEAGWISKLPLEILHLDLVRGEKQLDVFLEKIPSTMLLSLGIVNGRTIWKNDLEHSLQLINKTKSAIGPERIILAPSCSLLHVPYDLENEHDEKGLRPEVKERMAFAKQKIGEVITLKELFEDYPSAAALQKLEEEKGRREKWKELGFVHNREIQTQVTKMSCQWDSVKRSSVFSERIKKQQVKLNLPAFPTTMIGSLPQTTGVRKMRRQFINNEITEEEYKKFVHESIESAVRWQEEIDIDVLVHGEFERNDMVEFFGEQLNGFAFTQNGWVQSYGSRGVKPPVIYGDVSRKVPMTVDVSKFTQSLTDKPVKGMLTGPVTILQWSFVRDDQPRKDTTVQIALAIRDEVLDLEKAGLPIIQIDEPALREGLPIQQEKRAEYLKWAVDCFKLSYWGVKDETQIHTHMCYAEFNDIIQSIIDMDADVISIETSRSQMELLKVFSKTKYPNQIGPGVYDIHSPRIPSVNEMTGLLYVASRYIDAGKLWVNPDCGLKTRAWEEVMPAIENMVKAAIILRESIS